jgi:hypothetical protein
MRVVCDHAGRRRCAKPCIHAVAHMVRSGLGMKCTDAGKCEMNTKYQTTYARVRCVSVKEKGR